jgi:hypothetical protein
VYPARSHRSLTPTRSLAFFALGLAMVATPITDNLSDTHTPLFLSWLAVYLVLELSITGLIVLGLWRKRSGTAHGDRIVWRVILLTAECQLVPSAV